MAAAPRPVGQQGRLPEPGRPADQDQRPGQPVLQRLCQSRARHEPRLRAGQVQLGGSRASRPEEAAPPGAPEPPRTHRARRCLDASPEDSTRKAPSGDAQTRKAHIACPETQDMPRLEGWQWLLSGWTSSPPAPQADLRPAGLARAGRLQVIPGPGTAAGAGSLPGHSPAPWGQAGDRHAPGADETADGPTRPGGMRLVRFSDCWPSGCGATPRMCTEID